MTSPHPDLPPAVSGERFELSGAAGRLAVYRDGPESNAPGAPLLLVHSVNAAASAFEMKPLYEHYRHRRPVYAFDLPGFGFSERGDRDYTPRLMTDAVARVAAHVRAAHAGTPVDAVALSLGCEFLARAASESPDDFASLALVSPTAFNGTRPRRGPAGSNRGMAPLYRIFTLPLFTQAFFAGLTSRPSVRFFLRKTFGSRDVDPDLVDYAWRSCHQPGARHAPYRFVTGYLFSGDAFSVYETLGMPVWMSHGVRGDFQDYRLARLVSDRPNWSVTEFQTGALPHYEETSAFVERYDAFVGAVRDGEAAAGGSRGAATPPRGGGEG